MKSSTATRLWAADRSPQPPVLPPAVSRAAHGEHDARQPGHPGAASHRNTVHRGFQLRSQPTEQRPGTGSFPPAWLEGLICLPGLITCSLKINYWDNTRESWSLSCFPVTL